MFGTNTDDGNRTWTISNRQAHGEYNHCLTISEMPAHIHNITGGSHQHRLAMKLDDKDSPQNLDYLNYDGYGWGSYYNLTKNDGGHTHDCGYTGGSLDHNNMPPYMGVYMWERTA